MRIGIVGLLHESNTFLPKPTVLADFERISLLEGDEIFGDFEHSHHELGGFIGALRQADAELDEPIEAVPVFVARAIPSGIIEAETWQTLMDRLFRQLDRSGPLDGVLVAPHGATVSERHLDADGHWLSELRKAVGAKPIIGTIDPHANLSAKMVEACDALTAYRTNPHVDQRQRGEEAARLMVRTLRGEIRPVMHAQFPPLTINIERQATDEPHLSPVYKLADEQLTRPGMLTNSIVLGFPYADVPEMGTSAIAVADDDFQIARLCSEELAGEIWNRRDDFIGRLVSVDEALDRCLSLSGSVCLLDMGDNVGGGSAADGTTLIRALHERRIPAAFACLYDPQTVKQAQNAGAGAAIAVTVGGKSDDMHGAPLPLDVRVRSLHEGKFCETQVRHGGFSEFDQGPTAVVETEHGLTLMLTSRRVAPFSLQQLISCGLDPKSFRLLVAKGVNAPLAAYREVCEHFLRVNTPGSTCADLEQLDFTRRRRPMFPFEADAAWPIRAGKA